MSGAALALLLVLSADRAPLKVAAAGMKLVGIPAELGTVYSQQLAQDLSKQGLQVISREQLEAVLGMERQRELLGCSDAACLAEIASALNTEAMIIGSLARVGSRINVSVTLVNSSTGAAMASWSGHASRDEDIASALEEAARSIGSQLHAREGLSKKWALLPLGFGVAGAAVTLASLAANYSNHVALTGGDGVSTLSYSDAQATQQRERTFAVAAWISGAVTFGCLAIAVLLYTMGAAW